jgi:hypothetical protein
MTLHKKILALACALALGAAAAQAAGAASSRGVAPAGGSARGSISKATPSPGARARIRAAGLDDGEGAEPGDNGGVSYHVGRGND